MTTYTRVSTSTPSPIRFATSAILPAVNAPITQAEIRALPVLLRPICLRTSTFATLPGPTTPTAMPIGSASSPTVQPTSTSRSPKDQLPPLTPTHPLWQDQTSATFATLIVILALIN